MGSVGKCSKRLSISILVRYFVVGFLVLAGTIIVGCGNSNGARIPAPSTAAGLVQKPDTALAATKPIKDTIADSVLYKELILRMVNGKATAKWPVKEPFPLPGAILPYRRIVAYYGNFYTPKMGILGEVPPDSMLKHLMNEVDKWNAADSLMPVLPALHYVAVTAQAKPGPGNKYRARMPFAQIDKAIELTKKVKGILFLDIQVGWGSLEEELPPLEVYLRDSNIHLGIDPEYSMKGKQVPCTAIGTFDAEDINVASEYLAQLVRKYKLPPKVLVVHRFTKQMVTNYSKIKQHPEVQIVMHMDGFGFPAKKVDSYKQAIVNEPVQYAGFKLFYKNDIADAPHKMMTPEAVLKLTPRPVYIQYQ